MNKIQEEKRQSQALINQNSDSSNISAAIIQDSKTPDTLIRFGLPPKHNAIHNNKRSEMCEIQSRHYAQHRKSGSSTAAIHCQRSYLSKGIKASSSEQYLSMTVNQTPDNALLGDLNNILGQSHRRFSQRSQTSRLSRHSKNNSLNRKISINQQYRGGFQQQKSARNASKQYSNRSISDVNMSSGSTQSCDYKGEMQEFSVQEFGENSETIKNIKILIPLLMVDKHYVGTIPRKNYDRLNNIYASYSYNNNNISREDEQDKYNMNPRRPASNSFLAHALHGHSNSQVNIDMIQQQILLQGDKHIRKESTGFGTNSQRQSQATLPRNQSALVGLYLDTETHNTMENYHSKVFQKPIKLYSSEATNPECLDTDILLEQELSSAFRVISDDQNFPLNDVGESMIIKSSPQNSTGRKVRISNTGEQIIDDHNHQNDEENHSFVQQLQNDTELLKADDDDKEDINIAARQLEMEFYKFSNTHHHPKRSSKDRYQYSNNKETYSTRLSSNQYPHSRNLSPLQEEQSSSPSAQKRSAATSSNYVVETKQSSQIKKEENQVNNENEENNLNKQQDITETNQRTSNALTERRNIQGISVEGRKPAQSLNELEQVVVIPRLSKDSQKKDRGNLQNLEVVPRPPTTTSIDNDGDQYGQKQSKQDGGALNNFITAVPNTSGKQKAQKIYNELYNNEQQMEQIDQQEEEREYYEDQQQLQDDPVIHVLSQQQKVCREHLIHTYHAVMFSKQLVPTSPQIIRSKRVKLPSLPNKKVKTIVFDLDETLIHCLQKAVGNPYLLGQVDAVLDVKFPTGQIAQAPVNVRPHAIECLRKVSERNQVIVFTASHQCYADVILDYLDPEHKMIHHRFYREHCVVSPEGIHIKNLQVLGNRSMKNVVIIDNAVYSFGYQLDNGIPMIPFYDNRNDKQLVLLMQYLESLQNVDDVRQHNRKAFSLHNFNQEKLKEQLSDCNQDNQQQSPKKSKKNQNSDSIQEEPEFERKDNENYENEEQYEEELKEQTYNTQGNKAGSGESQPKQRQKRQPRASSVAGTGAPPLDQSDSIIKYDDLEDSKEDSGFASMQVDDLCENTPQSKKGINVLNQNLQMPKMGMMETLRQSTLQRMACNTVGNDLYTKNDQKSQEGFPKGHRKSQQRTIRNKFSQDF